MFENGDTVRINGEKEEFTIVEVREPDLYLLQFGTDVATRKYKKGDELELLAKVKKPAIEPGLVPDRSIMADE